MAARLHVSPTSYSGSRAMLRNLDRKTNTFPKEWPICIQQPFQNCERIFPIQQKKVKAMIEELSMNPNVNKVVIFGSSVTSKCHIDSDVDLYVELTDNQKISVRAMDFVFDLWTNYSVEPCMYDEIQKKGVVVYER